MALASSSAPSQPVWRALRAVCPHCGSSHVHRTHRKTATDYALGLAGVRRYRCTDCYRKHRAVKWLKLIGPVTEGTEPRKRKSSDGEWKLRYRSWRLREGRCAQKTAIFALVLLAAVGGFFVLLWHSARFLSG